MNPRRLSLIAVAVVVVLCIVGVSVAAVAAGGQALAYTVNGHQVSQSEVDGQLDDLANSPATKQASTTNGSIASRATAQVLTLNIARDLLQQTADRRGVKVTDADRTSVRQDLGPSLSGYPASYRDLGIDVQSLAKALGLDTNSLDPFLARELARADVHVNPRYGTWNPRFGVCPPTGCASIANQSNGG